MMRSWKDILVWSSRGELWRRGNLRWLVETFNSKLEKPVAILRLRHPRSREEGPMEEAAGDYAGVKRDPGIPVQDGRPRREHPRNMRS